jgi:pilus assembly protein CpaB
MYTRSRTIIAAGVAAALLGALLVMAYARSAGQSSGGPSTSALVATKDYPAGTQWEDVSKGLASRSVPADLRPSTAVTAKDALNGRRSVRAIAKGEVVTSTQFGTGESAPAGGLEIPAGHNALSISMPVPQGVGRYPQSGDLVNMYVTFKRQGDGTGARTITKLLLSNVQVLSTRAAGSTERSTTASDVLLTLALTPQQSERVVFSKENGSLWFALVHSGDKKASTSGRTFEDVLR